ncbi:MAG: hypothetical protein PHW03_07675 [Eubacteriales bacterium]|nr:hypothetical protein [Eubacteriales bacterium]MDD4390650.1 hypothetical protein [Eubacteriales bacterium]
MAVVAEYILDSGVRVKINDESYIDKTPGELKKIKDNINEVASRLIYQNLFKKSQASEG